MNIYYRRDYALKIILNFEGTLYHKRDYDIKNTLNSEGTKKKGSSDFALSRKREKRERFLDNSKEFFGVFFN